jgi:chromate reductase
LRADSHNTALLRTAEALAPADVTLKIYDGLGSIPPFNEDHLEPRPASVVDLESAVMAADGLLIATPEYNSSVPGVLKNALDWMSRPLESSPVRNKPTAVIGASTGMFGAIWAQDETRKIMSTIGARVIKLQLPVASVDEKRVAGGLLDDEDLKRELRVALEALANSVRERQALSANPT